MSDPGISIPQAPSSYYCANCGMYHLPGLCGQVVYMNPVVPATPHATAAEVVALRAALLAAQEWIERTGKHQGECRINPAFGRYECTCGLAALVKQIEEALEKR